MYPSINILILDIKISQNIRQCYYLHTNEECISSINKLLLRSRIDYVQILHMNITLHIYFLTVYSVENTSCSWYPLWDLVDTVPKTD